jgi:hypothetical protein
MHSNYPSTYQQINVHTYTLTNTRMCVLCRTKLVTCVLEVAVDAHICALVGHDVVVIHVQQLRVCTCACAYARALHWRVRADSRGQVPACMLTISARVNVLTDTSA